MLYLQSDWFDLGCSAVKHHCRVPLRLRGFLDRRLDFVALTSDDAVRVHICAFIQQTHESIESYSLQCGF